MSQRSYVGAVPIAGIQCHLCRGSTVLTKAHIPPKCAGNTGERVSRMRPYLHDGVMLHDTPKDGGLWLRTICQRCNAIASQFDDAYGDFVRRIDQNSRLAARSFVLPSRFPRIPAVHVAPGRVARSLLHCMVARAVTAPSPSTIRRRSSPRPAGN
jgi:hypothetical protein